MRSPRFLDSTMARKFFLTFPFPSRAFISSFFFHFLSRIPGFRNVYSFKCHEQRSVSYRCEKDDNTRLYNRRIKMKGGRIEAEKCREKEKFLPQFIVAFQLCAVLNTLADIFPLTRASLTLHNLLIFSGCIAGNIFAMMHLIYYHLYIGKFL